MCPSDLTLKYFSGSSGDVLHSINTSEYEMLVPLSDFIGFLVLFPFFLSCVCHVLQHLILSDPLVPIFSRRCLAVLFLMSRDSFLRLPSV